MFSRVPFICSNIACYKIKPDWISNVLFIFDIFSEWLVNQHRDSAASYIGHYNLLDYFALVENETRARTKFNLLEVL